MNVANNLARGVPKIRVRPPIGPWVAHAACHGLDPDLFHPHQGEPGLNAKAICAACLVRADCLDYAVRTSQRFGIWGGLSERERRRLRVANAGHVQPAELAWLVFLLLFIVVGLRLVGLGLR